jgi:2,3-dihydro-2,3-dihydroxybenzoate dehydrogenase
MTVNGGPVMVTGAAGGIGTGVAAAFAATGRPVALLDRDEKALDDLVRSLGEQGGRVHGYAVDVADAEAVERCTEQAEQTLGPIDVLVHAAGVLRTGPAHRISGLDLRETFETNLYGLVHTASAVGRRMAARRAGSIVAVASNAGRVPRVRMAAYAASKAAALMYVRCLGLELAAHGVRCNTVSPGSTDTAMLRQLSTDGSAEQAAITGSPESYKVGIPLQRIARPADVAAAVLFLASDAAQHITMHDLVIDGGASL